MMGEELIADSMAVRKDRIIAVGNGLEHDEEYRNISRVDLKGKTVVPGFVDAHTHIYFTGLSMAHVKLDGLDSLESVLRKIRKHSSELKKNEWVVGDGFSPERWKKRIIPDKYMLDKVTGGRPAAIFSKDQHMVWVNSVALKRAGLNKTSPDPAGGDIGRFDDGEPNGILRELPGYFPVIKVIKAPSMAVSKEYFKRVLDLAHSKGVTGVHTMDGPEAFEFFYASRTGKNLGLRITHYPPPAMIDRLRKLKLKFNSGNDYFRVGGIKIFSDGSLGSQSALCFNKYSGSKNNFGIETNSVEEMSRLIRKARKGGFPCAIHAIGDKAVSNVLNAYERTPAPPKGSFHRIEHAQMMRRKDIARFMRLRVIASMQPSHCPSDIKMMKNYWGERSRNCFLFKTLQENGILTVFGSDVPIEPLDPIAGIDAAVNRKGKTGPAFYPNERISPYRALYGFTAAPWIATGRGDELGRLFPGAFADFVILTKDILKTPRTKIKDIRVEATVLAGKAVYNRGKLDL